MAQSKSTPHEKDSIHGSSWLKLQWYVCIQCQNVVDYRPTNSHDQPVLQSGSIMYRFGAQRSGLYMLYSVMGFKEAVGLSKGQVSRACNSQVFENQVACTRFTAGVLDKARPSSARVHGVKIIVMCRNE